MMFSLVIAAVAAVYLLGLLFVTVAVCQEIEAERYQRLILRYPRRNPRGRLPSWLWKFAGALLVIVLLGLSCLDQTYYNHFLTDLLFWPLLIIALCGCFIASAISPFVLTSLKPPLLSMALRLAVLGAVALLLGFHLSKGPQALATRVRALQQSPQTLSAVLEDTHKTPAGKSWEYSITVDGGEYRALDRGWWSTLEPGRQITFVRDPERTIAFGPDQIRLTGLGMLLVVCCLGLWSLVLSYPLWWFGPPRSKRARQTWQFARAAQRPSDQAAGRRSGRAAEHAAGEMHPSAARDAAEHRRHRRHRAAGPAKRAASRSSERT